MANCQMKNKAVAFNLLDPDEAKLLEYALKRKNFSKYIKRLIQRDIDHTFTPSIITATPSLPVAEQTETVLDDSFMGGLI